MADTGDDGSSPPQDLLDSSPSDIKLFLGTQVPGGQEVEVSRAALKDMSPVFKNMLTHNMVERIHGQVRLEKVSMETWNVISAFYFSGEDRVCMDNVEKVVSVADMYELTKLKDHCDDYLCQNGVNDDDIVEMLNRTCMLTLTKLKEKYLEVARKDFTDFCQNESYLRLNRDVLLEFLCGPYVMGDERTVCLAVMRWLEAQNADCQMVKQLFHHLKLNEVCLCCLEKHVAECENATVRDVVLRLVETEKQAREMGSVSRFPVQYFLVSDIYGYRRLFPTRAGKPFGRRSICACPREPDLIFVGRDEAHGRPLTVGAMNVSDTWTALRSTPTEMEQFPHAACVFDGCLVLAGLNDRNWSTSFYDLRSHVWRKGPPLTENRESHALVSTGDALYAVMGWGNKQPLSSIETYSKNQRQWLHLGKMQQAAFRVCAVAVGSLILAHGVTWEQGYLQSFNTETKAAVVLEGNFPATRRLVAFGLWSRGAVFVQEDDTLTVCVDREGQLTVSKGRLPKLKGVFELEKESCNDDQTAHTKQPRSDLKTLQKTRAPFFVQHDLAGGRANLTPFPALADKDVTFLLRP